MTRKCSSLAVAAILLTSVASAQSPKPAAPAAPAPPAQPPAASGPAPKMVIDETTYNKGDIPKGEPVVHDFTVKNTGKGDLLILEVKPSCGCTAPDWTKVVPPGGTGKISLKVDTAKFKGPISKTATVTTNDPEQPSLRLVMNATVTTFIDILPRDTVSFRQYRGEEKKEEVTIKSNEPGEFKINDVQLTGEGLKHELTKAGAGEYKLALWLDKATPVGSVNGTAKLLTSSAKEPEVTVMVRGTVLGQISVNPSTLYFRVDTGSKDVVALSANLNVRKTGDATSEVVGKANKDDAMTVLEEAGDWTKVKLANGVEGWVAKKYVAPAQGAAAKQSKVLNVSHREATAFQVTSSSVEGSQIKPEALKVDTKPVKEGQSYQITVTYDGGLPKGQYTGALILKTTDKQEPEVKVPVYIVVT